MASKIERWQALLVDGTRRRMRLERTATHLFIDGEKVELPEGREALEMTLRAYGARRGWAIQQLKEGTL